jgi:hypothetical protein
MRRISLLLSLILLSVALFGQAKDTLAVRVSPYRGKTSKTSSVYVADYSGSEYMFDAIVLSSPETVPPKLMFNCRVEIRRGGSWEVLKAKWSGAQPGVMKVKGDGKGFPNACRFVLPKEGGEVGDCVRIAFRNDWFPSARTVSSEPFLIEANVSTVRSCKQ